MAAKPATAAVTNPQSAIIIDRSVKSLATAVAAVTKATAELNVLVEQSDKLSQDIEDKNAQVAELAARNDIAIRQADAELRLRVTENRAAVLRELLAESGLAEIKAADLDALRKQVSDLLAKDDAELRAAVAAATQSVKREAEFQAKQVEAETKVQTAQKDATIAMLNDKEAFLTAQLKTAQAQIEAERQTRLEIAKADAGRQGVTVNAGKQ